MLHLLLAFMLVTSGIPAEEFTTYSIQIFENGDALVTVTQRIPLETMEDVEAWNHFASNYSLSRDYEQMLMLVISQASEELGRNMSLSDFNLSIRLIPGIGKSYGMVEYSFVWHNFSVLEEDRISAGDVFIGGLYISSGETLAIHLPESCSLLEVSPPPDEMDQNRLVWYGPREFHDGTPRVVLERKAFSPLFIIPFLILPLILLLYLRSRTQKRKTTSDEEVIIELLKDGGGEMLQSEIVRRTGFSKSKVSVLISRLQKEGKVEKVMKGRENLIRLRRS
ncbi:MAG: hypothetical protein PWR09_682 [Archaeoglobi archaeon]|nr:DUF4897 domain-containing protein [Candidatus Mnemosynella bozhongmuii]MDI3502557.1 hypothetical protein [Archaeoglobi archaeon]